MLKADMETKKMHVYYFFTIWQNTQQKLRKMIMQKWVIIDFGGQNNWNLFNRISILVR